MPQKSSVRLAGGKVDGLEDLLVEALGLRCRLSARAFLRLVLGPSGFTVWSAQDGQVTSNWWFGLVWEFCFVGGKWETTINHQTINPNHQLRVA